MGTEDHLKSFEETIFAQHKVSYQVPVRVPKGSVIMWLSTTLHSGGCAEREEIPTALDPFKGWRGVVYVCHRPKEEFTTHELDTLERCIKENRGTNHTSTRVFATPNKKKLYARMEQLVTNPELVYELLKYQPDPRSFDISHRAAD